MSTPPLTTEHRVWVVETLGPNSQWVSWGAHVFRSDAWRQMRGLRQRWSGESFRTVKYVRAS
jgi:hypothetical protein